MRGWQETIPSCAFTTSPLTVAFSSCRQSGKHLQIQIWCFIERQRRFPLCCMPISAEAWTNYIAFNWHDFKQLILSILAFCMHSLAYIFALLNWEYSFKYAYSPLRILANLSFTQCNFSASREVRWNAPSNWALNVNLLLWCNCSVVSTLMHGSGK